jgi:hypothetical protein
VEEETSVQFVDVPYTPNKTQLEVHNNLTRYNVVVLHRGCGKSYLAINELLRQAFQCEDRSGAVFHGASGVVPRHNSVRRENERLRHEHTHKSRRSGVEFLCIVVHIHMY